MIFCYVSLEFAVTSALVSSLNVVGEELSFAVVRPSGTLLAINRLEVGCVKCVFACYFGHAFVLALCVVVALFVTAMSYCILCRTFVMGMWFFSTADAFL